MIKEVRHYICDCCGQEILDEELMETVKIPVTHIDHHDVRSKLKANVDLCGDCYEKMYELIKNEFANFEIRNFQSFVKNVGKDND